MSGRVTCTLHGAFTTQHNASAPFCIATVTAGYCACALFTSPESMETLVAWQPGSCLLLLGSTAAAWPGSLGLQLGLLGVHGRHIQAAKDPPADGGVCGGAQGVPYHPGERALQV